MNKETLKLFEFMVNNPKWINKLKTERQLKNNYKDFTQVTEQIINEILTTEKQFYDYPKNNIQLNKIVSMYF